MSDNPADSLRQQLDLQDRIYKTLVETSDETTPQRADAVFNAIWSLLEAALEARDVAARADERERIDGEWIVRLIPDELDGGWIASCDNLPGCMAQGENQADALHHLSDAVALVMEVRSAGGV